VSIGQINAIALEKPLQKGSSAISVGKGYEYFIDSNSLLLNIFDDSLAGKKIAIDALSPYLIQKEPIKWLFYSGKGSYAERSGAMPIHQLQIELPECMLGNVCTYGGDFSVALPNATDNNSGKFAFFVNNTDVTMLIYYDAADKLFKVKNYYQGQFFAHFTDGDNYFRWKLESGKPSDSGRVRILLTNKRLSGRFVDSKGGVPPQIEGRTAVLRHDGSNLLVPHTFEVEIDAQGRYVADGLPTLGYRVSVKDLAAATVRMDSISKFDNVTELSLVHTLSEPASSPQAEDNSTSYTQFGMFNKEGFYARTAIDEALTLSINAVVPIARKDFKVHLYNTDGKALDVTTLYSWSTASQSATISKNNAQRLYSMGGTLAATFCDSGKPDRCFRIKKELYTGDLSPQADKEPFNPIITEDGMDYTMCPAARPLCGNAFVDISGVNGGIYNGKEPLRLVFPVAFKGSDVKVMLEGNSDITEMFAIQPNRRAIALRKEFIPAFLSVLSNTREPILLLVNDKRYHLSLVAGYKSLEVVVAAENDIPTILLEGLSVKLSCEDQHYTQSAEINSAGIVSFQDLPDCTYSMDLVDDSQIFAGHIDGVRVSSGQSQLHTRFPVTCVGSDDQYIENCQPIIPIVSRRLIAPDFGVLFAEDLDNLSVSEGIEYKVLGKGITLFAAKSSEHSELKFASYTVPLEISDISDYLIRTLAMPEDKPGTLRVSNVTPSFALLEDEPPVFEFDIPFTYDKYAVKVTLDGKNLSDMFIWTKGSLLTILESKYSEFVELFANRQQALNIELTADAQSSYTFSAVLGVGASDIVVQAVGDSAAEAGSARALLIGRRAKNGNEYRQLADLSANGRARFAAVPLGIYDIIIFAQAEDIYGSKEVEVQTAESDLYIELPIKRLVP
jgi:hypothetical protein